MIRHDNRHMLAGVNAAAQMLAPRWRDRIRMLVWKFAHGIRVQHSHRHIAMFGVLSVVVWLCYAASLRLVLEAFAIPLSPDQFLLVFVTVYLSLGLPSGPGFLGTLQYPVSLALTALGIDDGVAHGFSIMLSLVMVPTVAVLGIWYSYRSGFYGNKPVPAAGLGTAASERRFEEMRVFFDGYFKAHPVSRLINRLDVLDKTQIVSAFKGGSAATTVLISKNDQLYVRKIEISQNSPKLRSQYEWLMARQNFSQIPRVLDHRETAEYFLYDMEYKPAFEPAFAYLHSCDDAGAMAFVDRVTAFCFDALYQLEPAHAYPVALRAYLEDKLAAKVAGVAAESPVLAALLEYPTIIVNNTEYTNYPVLLQALMADPARLETLAVYRQTPVHGDVTVDNLLADKAGAFILLDPNNENVVSAPEIDMAKLYQSFRGGYEFLCGVERVRLSGNRIDFADPTSRIYDMLRVHLDRRLPDYLNAAELASLTLHEAVHFARMLPYRHYLNPETMIIFYARMVQRLNDYMRSAPR